MKPMTRQSMAALAGLVAALLGGCDSIGDGNTIKTLKLSQALSFYEQSVVVNPNAAGEKLHMYDCFCANLGLTGIFNDGTSYPYFATRAKFTSSDPSVVSVSNLNDPTVTACPLGQNGAGLLLPHGPGTATITAEFAGLKDTIDVEVVDTASAGTFDLHPLAPSTGQVGVGASMPMIFDAVLDGRVALLNNNVTSWTVDAPADDNIAKINGIGQLLGVSRSNGTITARANFGACSFSQATAVQVGDIVPPLALAEESGFTDDAGNLNANTSELLAVTANLDFDGDPSSIEGSQVLSTSSRLSFTDTCTKRTFDASQANGCLDTPGSACDSTTPLCSTSVTTCTSTSAACRVAASPIGLGETLNMVRAFTDQGTTTVFSASFPAIQGTATTLAADIDNATTSIALAALTGYPTIFPWFGVIDSAGTREDVKVTAATGTTLTVTRGVNNTSAAAHLTGATFEQRSYASDGTTALPLTAKAGTLTTLTINPPGTLDSQGQLQLDSTGFFDDGAGNTRNQRTTRLTSSVASTPTINWLSSATSVAVVGTTTGVVTSTNVCGGNVSIRVRASTSTDTTTKTFDSTTTTDDDNCKNSDPLCDQVELCVATPNPLPLGASCPTVTTCP